MRHNNLDLALRQNIYIFTQMFQVAQVRQRNSSRSG